jgi:hypothetical protein
MTPSPALRLVLISRGPSGTKLVTYCRLMDARRLKNAMGGIVAKLLVASQLLVQEVRLEPWRPGLRIRQGMEIYRLRRRAQQCALIYPRAKHLTYWIPWPRDALRSSQHGFVDRIRAREHRDVEECVGASGAPSFQAHYSPVKTVFPKHAKNARKSQNTPSTNPYQNETQFSSSSLKSGISRHP